MGYADFFAYIGGLSNVLILGVGYIFASFTNFHSDSVIREQLYKVKYKYDKEDKGKKENQKPKIEDTFF